MWSRQAPAGNLIISPEKPVKEHPYYAKQQRGLRCGVIDPDSSRLMKKPDGYTGPAPRADNPQPRKR